MQTANVVLRVLFKPVPERLPFIHQIYGPRYDEQVLPSLGNEILKATMVCNYLLFILGTIRCQ
jgi:prohibitin 1